MAIKQGNPPCIHIVKDGDTLWDMAVAYYGIGFRFTVIQDNNGGIAPESLFVGQVLKIPLCRWIGNVGLVCDWW